MARTTPRHVAPSTRRASPENAAGGVTVTRPAASSTVTVLRPTGELDLVTAPALHADLQARLTRYRHVVVDLSDVTFLACRGVAVLIMAHHAAEFWGAALHVCGAQHRPVARSLAVAGGGRILDIAEHSADDLVEHLGAAGAARTGGPDSARGSGVGSFDVAFVRSVAALLGPREREDGAPSSGPPAVVAQDGDGCAVDTFGWLVRSSVDLLDVDAAGVLLDDPSHGLQPLTGSEPAAEALGDSQLRADDGPAVECARSAAELSVTDLTDRGVLAARWPAWTDALAPRSGPYRSLHALPLRDGERSIGSLSLYRRRPGAVPGDVVTVAHALADVATGLHLSRRSAQHAEVLIAQLQTALDSRVLIEQAKGVYAARHDVSVDAAFEQLRHLARTNNLRLREVARSIIEGTPVRRRLRS